MANNNYRGKSRGNDSRKVTGFRDGQPVFKKYGENKGGSDSRRPYGGERKGYGNEHKSYADRNENRYGDGSERRFSGEKKFGGDRRSKEKRFEENKPYGRKSYENESYDVKSYRSGSYGNKNYDKKRFDKFDRFDENEERSARFLNDERFSDRPSRFNEANKFADRPRKANFRGTVDEKPRRIKPDGYKAPEDMRFKKRDFDRSFNDLEFERAGFIVEQNEETRELPNIIMGRNPVKEAIKSGKSIDRILVTKEHDGSLGEIIGLARDLNLVIREVDRAKLDEICMPFGHGGKTGNHQGIVAEIPGVEYVELSDILEYAQSRNEKPFIVLLDGIEDPHNLGSIIRSAECAGVHGVVITKRRSASVTAAVVKTSAGAAEHMRIARVVNLSNTIDSLKEYGLWIAGADMEGKLMYDTDMKGGFALVIGSEGNGLSKLVKEKCDFLVSIPIKGNIDSLNAAVAGAIIMFEKNRQELQK